jgi:sensor c-di-GMP phosphodiesterase-like protein
MGHPVYIDDFGTGYSSLAYLHDLKISAIKIDRAFTSTVGTEALTASVVPQILQIASGLNLLVVVEGIETERQARYFRTARTGIRGQGWLFGKPVPAAHFKRLFSDSLSSMRQMVN